MKLKDIIKKEWPIVHVESSQKRSGEQDIICRIRVFGILIYRRFIN